MYLGEGGDGDIIFGTAIGLCVGTVYRSAEHKRFWESHYARNSKQEEIRQTIAAQVLKIVSLLQLHWRILVCSV